MHSTGDVRSLIEENALKLRKLEAESRTADARLGNDRGAMAERQRNADAFRARYDELAFPGGLENGLRRMEAGDVGAIETAILYLEMRPFHIRAEKNRKLFIRILKGRHLPEELQKRFEATLEKSRAWRAARREARLKKQTPPCPRSLR